VLLLSIVILSTLCVANAWLSTGHILTATIAYNELKQNNPQVLAKAEAILEPLRKFFLEPHYAFISAAEWPDDIKGMQWKNFNILHFVDIPVIDPSFEGEPESSVDNAALAFKECKNTLTNGTGNITVIGKSMCMRFLIHIIGDVHQPLHTASLFSKEFPDGDLGGNKFEIFYPSKHSLNELHVFWDSTGNKYSAKYKVPLSEKYYDELQEIAANITERYNKSSLKTELRLKEFEQWIEESSKHAYETAYDSLKLKSGDTITDEYEAKARELIDHQLALGGFRLADALTTILKSGPSPVVEELLKQNE
jgi:hypothetical protein